MKAGRLPLSAASLLLAAVPVAFGDSLPAAADASTDVGRPFLPAGGSPLVLVRGGLPGPQRHGFVRFDLSALPSGTTLARATLRAWVSAAPVPGTVSLALVSEAWQESTLTAVNAPATLPPFASLPVTGADVSRYVSLDVTSQAQAWLDGTQPNHGFALLPGTPLVLLAFDSKENAGTSHPMELELVPVGPSGPPGPPGPPGPEGPPGPDHGPAIAALQQQVAQLGSRVSLLEQRVLQPVVLSVDCGAGESLSAALSQAPPFRHASISVSGLCHESIQIGRDDVTITGVTPDAGIAGAPGTPLAVFVSEARNVRLDDLGLRWSGQGEALRVLKGQVAAGGLRVVGAVSALRGSTVELFNSEISGAAEASETGGNGVYVGSNSYLGIFNSTIAGSLLRGIQVQGGVLEAGNTHLEGNAAGGLLVERGGSATLQQLTSSDNPGPGLEVRDNATAHLDVQSVIAHNTVGVRVGEGSHVHLGSVSIESNTGSGVVIADASSVDALFRLVGGGGPLRVTGNGGWGVDCAPSPEVPQLTGNFDAATVFGNAAGQINCPGP